MAGRSETGRLPADPRGFPPLTPERPPGLARLRALARHPRAALGLAWERLLGRRVRAGQGLAAIAGVDHRLWLPPEILARVPAEPASERLAVPGLTILGVDAAPAAGHALATGARDRIEAAFAEAPDLQALYGDALVQLREGGPVAPLLRATYDPDLLAGVDAVGPVLAVRAGALAEAGGAGTGPAGLLARIAARHGPASIGHLPRVLSLWRPWTAPVSPLAPPPGEGLPPAAPAERPPASLLVPTRDRLDLLRPCLESLIHRTDWPEREILVLDNGSREPETLAYLAGLEAAGAARVVACPGPFDFAGMNNRGAALARGRLLVFVNNDVEAFRPDWLARMAREALRPEVGAVGAKLLDGAGRIQHGGVVLGAGGLVGHGHRHFPRDAPGYLGALTHTHRVAAVTAACLMVEAETFARVSGFDAERFAVDFNDVDLCLRLDAAGLRTLLVPGAVLHHREAASRRWTPEARARHAREVEALKERWGPLLAQDPHWHPGFDPDLSTHARLQPDPLNAGPGAVRRGRP